MMIGIADGLHERARRVRALWWFAWCVRVLLAVAFLPSGLTKVLACRSRGSTRRPAPARAALG